MNLTLHIILQTPPPGIDFALQKGHANKYESVQTQRSTGQDLHFNLVIDLRGDRQKDATPGFGGPFVQGPPQEKFLYIGIGTFAGQHTHWSRRLKIPLRDITWEMVEQAISGLETHVQGTANDGTPTCATVKPFAGWRVKMS